MNTSASLPRPGSWLLPLLFLLAMGCEETATIAGMTPTELPASTPLHNPGMGWTLEEFTSAADSPQRPQCRGLQPDGTFVDPFPEVDSFEIITSWAEIEPAEGQYDWSRIDDAIAFWNGRFGKRIRLRVSAEDLGCFEGSCKEVPSGHTGGIPLWLKSRVPLQVRIDGDGDFQIPDYRDPDYQAALRRMLKAYAERYRDNPAVYAVDLRGYGQWGEWHSGHDLDTLEQRREVLRWIIDTWYDAWYPGETPGSPSVSAGEKLVVLSASYEYLPDLQPAGVAHTACTVPGGYEAFKQNSAYDHAFTKRHLTLRRDGVGGVMCHELDGKLLLESFEQRPLPIIVEFFEIYEGFMENEADGSGYTLRQGLDEALRYHSNFITLPGYACGLFNPGAFYDDPRGFIREGLASGGMGYRLVLASADFPPELHPGESWALQQVWLNRNVGRSYVQYPLRVYLVDAGGKAVWSAEDARFDPRGFVKGSTYPVSSTFTLPEELPAGRYQLKIALVDPITGEPAVQLAIEGRDSEGRYSLGEVTVQ
jgi:hypothetical protein